MNFDRLVFRKFFLVLLKVCMLMFFNFSVDWIMLIVLVIFCIMIIVFGGGGGEGGGGGMCFFKIMWGCLIVSEVCMFVNFLKCKMCRKFFDIVLGFCISNKVLTMIVVLWGLFFFIL